jgi:hypothetical protein
MDNFLTTDACDRCGSTPLTVRTMSWFTTEAICMACSAKESELKQALRARGIDDAMEGCGFIPDLLRLDEQAARAADERLGQDLPEDFTLTPGEAQ